MGDCCARIWETKAKFYIVGQQFLNEKSLGKIFRILKVDKALNDQQLVCVEDQTTYSETELSNVLGMIDHGNKSTGGLKLVAECCGIIGFIRFSAGYYLYAITKAKTVAVICGHLIYTIESTSLIPLTAPKPSERTADEQRYIDVFLSVDLGKNFYFSYTYDLTQTLQNNMHDSGLKYREMMMWNHHLLDGIFQSIDKSCVWALPIIHGFISQNKLSIFGRTILLTLIARRSRHFAGVRYLKRGINDRGFVANEVESEQIVSDESRAHNETEAPISSFVQHRGSIPLYWAQELASMTPKPPIQISIFDPFYSATALHFDSLFERYGAPVIVLNLVKHKETTKRESLLLEEYTQATTYLNQFLPKDYRIKYVAFDMARAAKSQDYDVIEILEKITQESVTKVGIFHAGAEPCFNAHQRLLLGPEYSHRRDWLLQSGVIRTNCIDCLDRTNAAQFMVGRCALGHQLNALGLIPGNSVPLDCEIVKILTQMYHDHGDVIAFQYGGSALVNTMDTYRGQNFQSRDVIETMRRYYSNSFTDYEKQSAINLFLGNFVSHQGKPTLWELENDFFLHNARHSRQMKGFNDNYIKWFHPEHLDMRKRLAIVKKRPLHDFNVKHSPLELTSFNALHQPAETGKSNENLCSPFCMDGSSLKLQTRDYKAFSSSITADQRTEGAENEETEYYRQLVEQQPSISAEEEQEYRRYLDQFHSSSELSEISPTDLEFYSNYLDFRNFGGGQIPDQDIQLYESISKEPFLFRNFL